MQKIFSEDPSLIKLATNGRHHSCILPSFNKPSSTSNRMTCSSVACVLQPFIILIASAKVQKNPKTITIPPLSL